MCGALEEGSGEGRGEAGAVQARAPSWTMGTLEHLPQGWFHVEGKGPRIAPGLSVTVWGLPGVGGWSQEGVTSQGSHLLSGWGNPGSKGQLGAASSEQP